MLLLFVDTNTGEDI